MSFRLYAGLVRNNKWYNYADVSLLKGGTLTLLDGSNRSGAARLLNLIKGSITSVQTENGDSYDLQPNDYLDIKIADAWKIGYEQIKLTTGNSYPIIPESFYCSRCSAPNMEHYTDIEESWQKLIDDGLIDEFYLNAEDCTYEIELPNPIVIQPGRTIVGGEFKKIIMRHLVVGDMLKIQNNQKAMESDSALTFASWDAALIGVENLSDKDFNIIKRAPGISFSEKYLGTGKNFEEILRAEKSNTIGVDASARSITCKYCGKEIGGLLDQTNFFLPLLPKKSIRGRS